MKKIMLVVSFIAFIFLIQGVSAVPDNFTVAIHQIDVNVSTAESFVPNGIDVVNTTTIYVCYNSSGTESVRAFDLDLSFDSFFANFTGGALTGLDDCAFNGTNFHIIETASIDLNIFDNAGAFLIEPLTYEDSAFQAGFGYNGTTFFLAKGGGAENRSVSTINPAITGNFDVISSFDIDLDEFGSSGVLTGVSNRDNFFYILRNDGWVFQLNSSGGFTGNNWNLSNGDGVEEYSDIGFNGTHFFIVRQNGNFSRFFLQSAVNITIFDEITNGPFNVSAPDEMIFQYFCTTKTITQNVTGNSSFVIANVSDCVNSTMRLTVNFTEGSYFRTLIPDIAPGQTDINFFMINLETDPLAILELTLSDSSGQFIGSTISITKIIGTSTVDIIDQVFETATNKVILAWIPDERYSLSVTSISGEVRSLAGRFATTATEEILSITRAPFFSGTNLTSDKLNWAFTSNESGGTISFQYFDPDNATTNTQFFVINISNFSEVFFAEVFTGAAANDVRSTFSGADTNSSFLVRFNSTHAVLGTLTESRVIGFSRLIFDLGIPAEWYFIGSIFVVIVIGALFGRIHAGAGAILMALSIAILSFFGFLPPEITGALVILVVFLAIISSFGRRKVE